MPELEDDIYAQIVELSKEGNLHTDRCDYKPALIIFFKALDLVPDPKIEWDTSTWLYVAIGDCYFGLKQFEEGKHAFYDALNCPNSQSNPFIHLRLGQCLFELNDKEKAEKHLMTAYMLEGKKIFKSEKKKFILFLKEKYDL